MKTSVKKSNDVKCDKFGSVKIFLSEKLMLTDFYNSTKVICKKLKKNLEKKLMSPYFIISLITNLFIN